MAFVQLILATNKFHMCIVLIADVTIGTHFINLLFASLYSSQPNFTFHHTDGYGVVVLGGVESYIPKRLI